MPTMSYNDWSKHQEAATQRTADTPRINYFALSNDGDQALVRFMYHSTDEFEVVRIHKHKVNGKVRSVACLRNPTDPIDLCPLCANKVAVSDKAYIKLLNYQQGENGQLVPVPEVWERPAFFFDTLATRMTTYGPLDESLYIITRHGKAGDKGTKYDILPAPPTYAPADYPIDTSAFEGYNPVGSAVFDFKVADLETMLDGDNIDTSRRQATAKPNPISQPVSASQPIIPQAPVTPTPVTPQASYRPYTPVSQATTGFARPQRFTNN